MKMYRTLVRGKLLQCSSLSVGGSPSQPGGADIQVARDGEGRLTIPGTGLAGAFIETAGRVFPELLKRPNDKQPKSKLWEQITGKSNKKPPEAILQSLWRFSAAHRTHDRVELRQGVGIRQATGTAAVEGNVLYDVETIPPGGTWDFFLEIDTLRGSEKLEVETVAFRALLEWMQERCWLGAAAARGLGWMKLESVDILRLPATEKAIAAWPDNTQTVNDLWPALTRLAQKRITTEADLRTWVQAAALPLPDDRFHYLVLEGTIRAGEADDGWGLEAIAVGGHAAGFLKPLCDNLLRPLGVSAPQWKENYDSDAPIVSSGADDAKQRPILPGSGLRGPLRHAVSQWWFDDKKTILDPNVHIPEDHLPKNREKADRVAKLFGLTQFSGRVIVCDAYLQKDKSDLKKEPAYHLAVWQHHAEDEFAASVYGTGKFDRTAVVVGTFGFRIVIEAQNSDELLQYVETISPALRLAELGFVALGGGKQRGAGGIWEFVHVTFDRAGEKSMRWSVQNTSVVELLSSLIRRLF